MSKINKSKRVTVHIPEGTEIHTYLSRNNSVSKWELLNNIVKQLPKSRAEKADKVFSNAIDELSILYPETKEKWALVKALVYTQIIGIEYTDFGYEESKKRKISIEAFEELMKL